MADSARHAIYILPETVYGTTPTGAQTYARVRSTGTTLGLSKDSLISEELRPDRQIVDHQFGIKQVGGDIPMELTKDAQLRDLLEAGFLGAWSGATPDVLKAGTTRRSFTMLREFQDITGVGKYLLYSGIEVNTVNLTNSANDRTNITFGVLGQSQGASTADAPATSTLGTPSTDTMMTGLLGAVSEGGTPSGIITEASFTLENGLEIRPVIGSDLTLNPSIGRSNVSGQVTAYFEDGTLLNKFINGTSSSLEFECKDADDNAFKFLFPNIRYTGGQPDVSGQGSITLALPFQALYQVAADTQAQVTYVIA